MAITSSRIDLYWCNATDNTCVEFYKIYDASNDNLLGVTDGDDNDYSIGGLSAGTTYSFYAIALDCSGNESEPSNVVSATTLTGVTTGVPSDVLNLNYSALTATNATLYWDAATFPAPLVEGGYRIFDGDSNLVYEYSGVTNVTITGLTPATTYRFKMKAFSDTYVQSLNFSNQIIFNTLTEELTVPTDVTNLIISNITSTSIELSWSAATFTNGVGGYYIYNTNGNILRTTVGTGTTTTFTGLAECANYGYKVKAYDTAMLISNDFSNTVTGDTICITGFTSFNIPTAVSTSSYGFGITWTNPSNILVDSQATFTNAVFTSTNVSTDWIRVSDFNHAVPTGSTVTGIEVEIELDSNFAAVEGLILELTLGTSAVGSSKSDSTQWSSEWQTRTYGGQTDLWGLAEFPANIINSSLFGVRVRATNQSISFDQAQINTIRTKIYYT